MTPEKFLINYINKIWKLKLRFVKAGETLSQSLSGSSQIRSTNAVAISLILLITAGET